MQGELIVVVVVVVVVCVFCLLVLVPVCNVMYCTGNINNVCGLCMARVEQPECRCTAAAEITARCCLSKGRYSTSDSGASSAALRTLK